MIMSWSSSLSSSQATVAESPTVVSDQAAAAAASAAHSKQPQQLFRDDELNKLSMLPPSECNINICDGEYFGGVNVPFIDQHLK